MKKKVEDLFAKRIPEVWEFRGTLDPETDRGCALMAAAYLDSQLEELITRCLICDKEAVKEMLDQSRPLGTFSARIDMCYLLGRISQKARNDLHLIRRIRNDFGHNPSPLNFSSPEIANRCRELYHTPLNKNEPPRRRFTNAVLGVLAEIHVSCYRARRRSALKSLDLTPETKRRLLKHADEFVKRHLGIDSTPKSKRSKTKAS